MLRGLRLPLWLLLALGTAATAHAQEPGTVQAERISLGGALERLDGGNLELRLAREEVAVTEAGLTSASLFADPDLSFERAELSRQGGSYRETIVGLGQTFEIGGQRGLRRSVAEESVHASWAYFEAERNRLAFDVHREYIRAAVAEANLTMLADAARTFRRVGEMGEARFEEGDISRLHRNRLQLESARYETWLGQRRMALDRAARNLTLLIAPDSAPQQFAGFLPSQSLTELLARATGLGTGTSLEEVLLSVPERADVRAAAIEVELAETVLSLSRRERIPDLTVRGGYRSQGDGFRGAALGLSAPLPLWNRNRGPIHEAQATLDRAVARYEFVRRRAEFEIRSAWEVHTTLRERSRTAQDAWLPRTAGLLEAVGVAYAEGEMSLMELLDATDAYTTARESLNELLGDYLISLFDLQRATGRLMESMPTPTNPSSR